MQPDCFLGGKFLGLFFVFLHSTNRNPEISFYYSKDDGSEPDSNTISCPMESPLRAHARSLIASSISRLEARVHGWSAQQGGPGDHSNAHYPYLTGQTPSGPDADSCITECTTPDVRAVLVYELLPADNAADGLGGLVSNANRTNYEVQVVGGLV